MVPPYLLQAVLWPSRQNRPTTRRPGPGHRRPDHPIQRPRQNPAQTGDRLSQHTGRSYRLASEAEWEYTCRAGTSTPFYFGDTITINLANYDGNYSYGSGAKGQYREQIIPVGQFGVNPWGLADMHGFEYALRAFKIFSSAIAG
ncbi:MAG: formylglycine-generating enzyme family protein [Nodosilinea sp.]